jgi:hypothetical protein
MLLPVLEKYEQKYQKIIISVVPVIFPNFFPTFGPYNFTGLAICKVYDQI